MVPFIFETIILYLNMPFQIPDLDTYSLISVLSLSVKSGKLPLGRDVHIIFIGLKAGKHFNLNAVLYFKLASS